MKTIIGLFLFTLGFLGCVSQRVRICCNPVPFNTYKSIYVLDTEVNDSLNVKWEIQKAFIEKGFNILSNGEEKKETEYFLKFSYVPMIGKYWTKGAYDRYEYYPTFESFEVELFNAKTKQTVATMNYSQKGGDNESIWVILRKFTSRLYKQYNVLYLRQN
ncbi:MAG: hypothetical protein JW740_02715 [Candidatus Zambryskibacteria bacterium]|nr:hypothetical protein [Candidatus Zambryskibacteria bacterium]